MARGFVNPWWDPEEKLPVESSASGAVLHSYCMPCASCGEHSLVPRTLLHEEPWRATLCARCVRLPRLLLTFTCRQGHSWNVTAEDIYALRGPLPFCRTCRSGFASAVSQRLPR